MNAPLTLTSQRDLLTSTVKRLALECGLSVAAVSRAQPMPEVAAVMHDRIDAGHLSGMEWFSHERADVAGDIRTLQADALSVVSVGINYWPGDVRKPEDGIARGRISRYAWGRDYHRVLKRRLRTLLERIETTVGRSVDARKLVDTARVAERALAERSGLGWFGKHANIISPGFGSWVLLGELVLDLELTPDEPLNRNCGKCTICIDNCPTGAIVDAYTIHAPSCISYLTIEERGVIPLEFRAAMGDWVYGCDVCQEVCPYTATARPHDDAELQSASLNNAWPSLTWLLTMSEQEFGETYYGTPVPRTKRRGLARNAAIALGNIGGEADLPVLYSAAASHDEPLVRGHAAWALGQLGAATELHRLRRTEADAYVLSEIDQAIAQR